MVEVGIELAKLGGLVDDHQREAVEPDGGADRRRLVEPGVERLHPLEFERRGAQAAELDRATADPTQTVVDDRPIREALEAVRTSRRLLLPGLSKLRGVALAERPQRRLLGRAQAVLGIGQRQRVGHIEARKAHQPQRCPVDQHALVVRDDRSAVEVPERRAEALVADLVGAGPEGGDAVHRRRAAVERLAVAAVERPPREQLCVVAAGAERDQAAVVQAPAAQVGLVGPAAVDRQRRRGPAPDEHAVLERERLDVVDRPGQQRVGAEIEDRFGGPRPAGERAAAACTPRVARRGRASPRAGRCPRFPPRAARAPRMALQSRNRTAQRRARAPSASSRRARGPRRRALAHARPPGDRRSWRSALEPAHRRRRLGRARRNRAAGRALYSS